MKSLAESGSKGRTPRGAPGSPAGGGTTGSRERRRFPRLDICLAVTVSCASGTVEGFTENVSYSGLLIQSLNGMPVLAEECEVDLDLPHGMVHARGRVVRVNTKRGTFAIDLTHLDENGQLLLASLVIFGDDTRRP